jgi:hypothetical protein
MSYDKNAFKATGEKPHEAFDFIAYPGDKKTWAPTWGFVTTSKGLDESLEEEVFPRGDWPLFRFGGSFGGWVYGAAAHGGSPDDSGNVGPDVVTNYSDFAGVFGTGVYVTGVAGTSVNNVGVYGQTGELTDGQIPQNIAAGVYGATKNRYSYGVLGWSTNGPGIKGWSPVYNAVEAESVHGRAVSAYSGYETGVHGDSQGAAGVRGVSDVYRDEGPTIPNPVTIAGVVGTSDTIHGVIGTSNANVGVFGYSSNSVGIFGQTNNPASLAGAFKGNVYINGILAADVKSAVVPFPDGSRRVLHCMESPEHWFEDFGGAKLTRGRAVIKLDANFAKVIKRGDYRVFLTPEENCHGLYVRRKSANRFEVRELMGGKSSIAFSYRIVGRRKDIKQHRRFAKFDTPLPLPTRPPRPTRKAVPTAAGLRAFIARVEKEAQERTPKGVEKARARMRWGRGRPRMVPPRARA